MAPSAVDGSSANRIAQIGAGREVHVTAEGEGDRFAVSVPVGIEAGIPGCRRDARSMVRGVTRPGGASLASPREQQSEDEGQGQETQCPDPPVSAHAARA